MCLGFAIAPLLPSTSLWAAEPTLMGQVGLSVGYDDNVTYANDLQSSLSAGWAGLEPALSVMWDLDAQWSTGVVFAGVVRGYFGESSGWLAAQVLDVPIVFRKSPSWDLRVTAGADHFYTGMFSDSQAVGERLEVAGSFYWADGGLLTGLGVHARHWLDADFERTDVQFLPRLQVSQTFAEIVTVFVGYQFAPRRSTDADFNQWGHRAQIGLNLEISRDMDLMLSYMPYIRAYAEADSPWETAHTIRSRWSWHFSDSWRLDAEAEMVIQEGDTQSRSFTAHTASLGFAWTFGERWVADPLRIDDLTDPLPPRNESLAPLQLPEGVRFRLVDPSAQSVSLVGSFNDWDPLRNPLQRADALGLWETVVPLEVGTYEFGFVVDGAFRLPEQAKHYVQSGFGDVNGVVVVHPVYRNGP